MTTFKELKTYDQFDFVNDEKPSFNSFFKQCYKVSARRYADENNVLYTIGSINCEVFHVNQNNKD